MPSQLFDPIRQESIVSTPEERVRQHLIHCLVQELQFPPALLVVEKKISELLHLDPLIKLKAPRRRIDLLAFASTPKGLQPLLLVECKAGPLKEAMKRQLFGYNYFVKARHMALISEKSLWFFKEGLEQLDNIPTYQELLN